MKIQIKNKLKVELDFGINSKIYAIIEHKLDNDTYIYYTIVPAIVVDITFSAGKYGNQVLLREPTDNGREWGDSVDLDYVFPTFEEAIKRLAKLIKSNTGVFKD